jgi:hypothetical protein
MSRSLLPATLRMALRLATLKRLQFQVRQAIVAAPIILPIQPAGVRLPALLAAFGMDRKLIERRDPGSPSIALSPSSRRPAHITLLAPKRRVLRQRRNVMGGIANAIGPNTGDAALAVGLTGIALESALAAKVDHLSKLVHILWKEAERLEQIVQVIPEGLRIKSGASEVLVLKNGGIMINGLRVLVQTPGKSEFYY